MVALTEELASPEVKVQATALLQLLNMLATGSDSVEAVSVACKVRTLRAWLGSRRSALCKA